MEQSQGKKVHFPRLKSGFSKFWEDWKYQTKFTFGGNWLCLFAVIGLIIFGVVECCESCSNSTWAENHRTYRVGTIVPNYSNQVGLNIDNFNFNVFPDKRTLTMRVKTDSTLLNIEFLSICPIGNVRFKDSPGEHSLYVFVTKRGAEIIRKWEKEGYVPGWIASIHAHGQPESNEVPLSKEIDYIEIRMPKADIPKYVGIIMEENGTESE